MTIRRFLFAAVIAILSAAPVSTVSAQAVLETGDLRLVVDTQGKVSSFFDRVNGVEYAAVDQESALLRVRCKGRFEIPAEMHWDAQQGTMLLVYDVIGVKALVKPAAGKTHRTLNQELGAEGDGPTRDIFSFLVETAGMRAERTAPKESQAR